MTVGFAANKSEVDSRVGELARDLREQFSEIRNLKIWLDAQTDPMLVTLGYTAGEIATLRSSFIDLDQLRTVYEGTGTRSPAYDYRTFAKLLTGVV